MNTNDLSTSLVFGLAAFGLALVVAGVGLFRRRAGSSDDSSQDELQTREGTAHEEKIPETELPEDRDSHRNAPSNASLKQLPLDYFGLVVALTIPFWLFGGKPLPIPVKLPVSALALVIPLVAALILTYLRDGITGVKELFKRTFDYWKIKNKIWYLPVLFLYPVITILSYAIMRLARLPLPDPQIPWLMVPVYFLAFFIAGIFEELGWMGYAIDPMQDRWGALKASILLGLFWAIYHLIPDMQNQQAADWILWHRLGTVAFRILMVWAYNNTGKSVLAAILFHVTNNLSWALFPNNGSHYNPFITFLLALPVVAYVIFGWDSRTLARYRFARISDKGQETSKLP